MKNSEILREQQEPIGRQKPGMTRRQRVIVAIAFLLLIAGMVVLWLTTRQVQQLSSEGAQYTTLVPGSPGSNGKSAYEIAVDNGFNGTEKEWLATLKGVGENGLSAYQLAQVQGYIGSQSQWLQSLVGDSGLSAYQVAQRQGFVGTRNEWLASLIGQDGKDGRSAYQIAVDNGFNGTELEWLRSLVGPQGADGADGANGTTGATGATGPAGADGKDARQPVWACVVTTENNQTVRYYTQKYSDEPDSAYLTWQYRSRLPQWFVPNDCIDMRTAA